MYNNKRLLLFLSLNLLFTLTFTSCFKKTTPPVPDNSSQQVQPSHDNINNSDPTYSEEKTPEEGGNSVTQDIDPNTLNNNLKQWGLKPNSTHSTPEVPQVLINMLDKYSGYYVGNTTTKVIYLTFDEGYENGYTSKILDALKANNVKAAFFVTRPYILQNPDLIKRMVAEGHIVGNHSSKHPSMPSRTGDANAFNKEFEDVEKAFKEVTGTDMPKFFRPPMGEFSEKSLYMTQMLGYKSILWSFAHMDWDVNKQPSVEETINKVIARSHNGEIMLLHAVSKSNTEAMDTIIKKLQSEGYRFGELSELK
jgi:peptidoglycan-N-acetylmuramic acid deacetylase